MARPKAQAVRIFRVGGSVRDELLGRPDADRDYVVVGATPEILLASGFRPVGRDFPVFLHPETNEEYALARTERKHGRGYRGFEFFASPEVTLVDDLKRRDLTINAMARGDDGVLVDPYGGAADLAKGVLRHVSPAFAEDPLRVLRVARFAARFGFAVAPETMTLMRAIVASGELATLAPERVWQELARGLQEARPSRMLAVLRRCGGLRELLPELPDGRSAAAKKAQAANDAALDRSAAAADSLPVRFAVLADAAVALPRCKPPAAARRVQALAQRLAVPADVRDAARLTARWRQAVAKAAQLPPASLLNLLMGLDALRRPERLAVVTAACVALEGPKAGTAASSAASLAAALDVVRAVDAGAAARNAAAGKPDIDAVVKAVRNARLVALRQWRAGAQSKPSRA